MECGFHASEFVVVPTIDGVDVRDLDATSTVERTGDGHALGWCGDGSGTITASQLYECVIG